MISDLAHETIRLLDDFKSSSTDSRLLVLKDLETALNGFRDVHAAVQFNLAFALHSSTSNSSSENLVGYLLDVITGAVEDETALGLGGTLGAICRAGVQAKYMKKILKCLRGDDACANPIPKNEQRYKAQCRSVLHALEVMAHPLVETPLSCFFNFSGPGSGLFIPPIPWPFQSACQILLWFRVQEFTSSTSNSLNGDGNSSSSCTNSSIASFTTGEGIGIEYILEDNSLCMLTTIPGTKSAGVISRKTVISGDLPTLEINKWYSLMLQHRSPRKLYSSTKSTDQIRLRVLLNGMVTFDGPVLSTHFHRIDIPLVNVRVGKDLQGQISGVFLDAYNDEDSVAFKRLESLKSCYSYSGTLNTSKEKDLEKDIFGLSFFAQSIEFWRKGEKKALAAYMPYHCEGFIVREVTSGWHATFGPSTCTWVAQHPRETISCIGGIGALLPMLVPSCISHQLLIGEDYSQGVGRYRQNNHTSGVNGCNEYDWLPLAQVLLVLSNFLSGHDANQSDFIRFNGLEWVETAIACRPAHSFLNSTGTFLGDKMYEAKHFAIAVEHFCWSCAPLGSRAWRSSIIRLLGTMRIWGKAPSCFRTALVNSFERVTANATYIPCRDGELLPNNTNMISLSPASLLETLALSCPPTSSTENNCCCDDATELCAERKSILRILTPMVISVPHNGVELANRVLMCSATALANGSITFMGALLSLLHAVLSNESLRGDAMKKLLDTISKSSFQVVDKSDGVDLTYENKQQFALVCYLFHCCNVHTTGDDEKYNSGDKERLKATFIDVISDCTISLASFFEDENMIHLIPHLRRILLVSPPIFIPEPSSSSMHSENDRKVSSTGQQLIDVHGPACEALATFTRRDPFVYESYSSAWLSLMIESMLNTSLSVCSNTLLMMEQYFCGGIKEGSVRNTVVTVVPSSTDIASIHSSWSWQRYMVKIHVRLMMEGLSVKQQYKTVSPTSVQIHAMLLSESISLHSNWGEEVKLFFELTFQENEPCAKRAAILVLIKLVEAIDVWVLQNICNCNDPSANCILSMSDAAESWFWDNIPVVMSMAYALCEWCQSNGGLYRDDCLCLSTSILEMFDVGFWRNSLFPVSDSINSSYNWVKSSKTKEEKKGLKHKMEVLALSLLQLCSVVLEGASIENNPMWVLLNGKRITSVCKQASSVLSQCPVDQEEDKEESHTHHPICIAPLILSLANSALVCLYETVMRIKETSNEDNENNNQSSCIDAALALSDGLMLATHEAGKDLERSGETGACKVSEALLLSLRSALVESTTAPIPTSKDNWLVSNGNSDTSSWDTVCQSLEWVKRSRYFEPEISAELKSHAQDILNEFRIEVERPLSNTAVQYQTIMKEKSFEQMELCNRCEIEDEKLAQESDLAIAAFERESAIMKDGLGQLEQALRVLAQCNESLTLQVARMEWDGFMKYCTEEWSPWAPSGPVSYHLSCGEGSKMLQMLLMPTYFDNAIDYMNTAYNADETRPYLLEDIRERRISVVEPNPNPIPASHDALNNNLDISDTEVDDDEGVTTCVEYEDEIGNCNGSRSPVAAAATPESIETEGWEEITVEIAQAVEWDVMAEAQLVVQLGEKHGPMAGQWPVLMLLPGRNVPGTLFLSQKNLFFRSSCAKHCITDGKSKMRDGTSYAVCSASDYRLQRWYLRHLQGVLLRRYMLDERAVELFWVKADGWCSRGIFLAFDSVEKMKAFVSALKKLSYKGTFPLFAWPKSLRPGAVLRASRLTEAWKRCQITNFNYLVCLNIIAGRSYNDMTQYPVMPWVLADYESPELALFDVRTFRDLSKPVGALDEKRLRDFRERCKSFMDPVTPPFLYGSHYSSPGIVIHYLIRQEPYTSMHLKLQGNRFDCPDRLFFDVNQSWKNCHSSMSDVKELIPELFCCPDILSNSRSLPLGMLQDGSGKVHDVRLPPWASGSPHKFIRLHRMALESGAVSRHLDEWIDLVFGYKQRGEAALKSDNLFFYLTYEGAVNVASITDCIQREAVEAQVAHFGQTPSQLFTDPHPSRLPQGCIPPMCSSTSRLQVFNPHRQPGGQGKLDPVLAVCCNSSRIVVVHAKGLMVTTYLWKLQPDGGGLPFNLSLECSSHLPCAPFFVHSPLEVLPEIPKGGGGSQPPMSSKFSLVSSFVEGSSWMGITAPPPLSSANVMDCLISCGYWDGCLKVYSLNTLGVGSSGLSCLSSSRGLHMGRITCLASGMDGGECAVATGGEDMLVCVWRFARGRMCAVLAEDDRVEREMLLGSCTSPSPGSVRTEQQSLIGDLEMENNSLCCILRLYGHDAPITCLDICGDVGLIASGAEDGRILLHTIRRGSYIRSLWLPGGQHSLYHHPSPHLLCLSQHGDVIVYCGDSSSIHLMTVNGTHVTSVTTPDLVKSIVPTADGESIICSRPVKGEVELRSLMDLSVTSVIISDLDNDKPIGFPPAHIADISFSPCDWLLLIGLESGEIRLAMDVKRIYRLIAGALMPTTELEQSERQEKRLRTDSSHSWRAGFDENSPTPPPSPLSTGLRGKDTEEAVGGDDDEKEGDELKLEECKTKRHEDEKEGVHEENGNDNDFIEHIGGDVKFFFAKLRQEESTKELVGTVHSKGKSSYHMSKTRKTAESEGWECYKCNKRNPKNFTQCDCGSAKRLTEWR